MNLTFDSKKHEYFVDNKRIPSVTEIVQILTPRFQCDPWYLDRGRIGHLITQYYDQGELDELSIDPSLVGRIEAYKKFDREVNPQIIKIEITLYHPKYHYCGKPDRYGILFKWNSVWDIKFGAPAEADNYQVPAYLFLLKVNGYPAEKGFDIYLKDNGSYRVSEVKNPTKLFLKFLGGVKQWNSAQEEESMKKSVTKGETAQFVR